MNENYVKIEKQLDILCRPYYDELNDGHDIGHIHRTLKYAQILQKTYGGNQLVLLFSCYLHDLHRVIQYRQNDDCEVCPADSISLAQTIIEKFKLNVQDIELIKYSIIHHEESNQQLAPLETQLLQDADKLDAIGTIGIARAFAFGAIHKIPQYSFCINKYNLNRNTIGHIKETLLNIEKRLNTKKAKKIASKQIKYMKIFLSNYANESKFLFDK